MANTTLPLSETAVANMGGLTLDERRLNSLDDDTSYGRFVASEFGFVRDEFLARYPFAFSLCYAALPMDADHTPPFRWLYSYTLPSDCLRIYALRENGLKNGARIPHDRVGNKIYTNYAAPLPIIYAKRVTDLTKWDVLAARALGQYLALMAAYRTTGKTSYVDRAKEALQIALTDAFQTDTLTRGDAEDMEDSEMLTERNAMWG